MRKELMEYLFYVKENNLYHTPQSMEMQLCEAITTGNVPLLQSIIGRNIEGALGILSHDADRQARYMFVTAAAIFARAAMRGGMNYELACSMADVSCQEMDNLPHIDDLLTLLRELAMEFCQAVCEENNIHYSHLVNDCCIYIYNHSHETPLLEDLARLCGLSTRRLSLRFRKETGMSVGEYIHQTKINEAKLLLQYTDHSIGEIAFFLGFCNQSHFSQIFKSIVGITPIEFKQRKGLIGE